MRTHPIVKETGKDISRWFVIALCSCILLIFTDQASAQYQITLKGIVLDKQTDEPLPFATITIAQSQISVVTNEMGEFKFHIPEELENSIIQISYLGYKTIKIKANEIKPGEQVTFRMESQEQQLKEVEIKEKKSKTPAEDIVDRAIRNIKKNYPKDKTLYYGYYRDYISPVSTVRYQNLIEAALVIEDRGFQTYEYERTKIKLEQLRYNPGISVDSSLNKAYDGEHKFIPNADIKTGAANELAILRAHDPIRNHKSKCFSFVDVFDYNFVKNHRFYYESITEEDSALIYGIRFECDYGDSSYGSEFKVNGHIFINADTYAILKFNYTINCITPKYTGKFFDLKLEYKNYKNKYYLNYMSLMNYFVLKEDSATHPTEQPLLQYRELFINKIVSENFKSLPSRELIDKRASLLAYKVPVVKGFWDNYNYTGIPALEEQVITDKTRKRPY